jgi:hypothetical protein
LLAAALVGCDDGASGDDDDGSGEPAADDAGGLEDDAGPGGGDDPEADAGGGEPIDRPGGSCTRDPSRIAAAEGCRDDSTCPCGTACVLGRCEAACVSDADCGGGQYCDDFGECRAADDGALRKPARPEPEERLEMPQGTVLGTTESAERDIRVFAKGADIEAARAFASDGLEVRCAPDEEFASECQLPPLPRGEVHRLTVRPVGEPIPGTSGSVTVHAGRTAIAETTYRVEVGPAQFKSAPPPLAGTYRGLATLVGHGYLDAGAAPRVPLEIPFTADIHEDGVVALRDELGWLAGSGAWVGEMTWDEPSGTGTLELPAIDWLAGGDSGYAVGVASATVEVIRIDDDVVFSLPIGFLGLIGLPPPPPAPSCMDSAFCVLRTCPNDLRSCLDECLDGAPASAGPLLDALVACGLEGPDPCDNEFCFAQRCRPELDACANDPEGEAPDPLPAPRPQQVWSARLARVGDVPPGPAPNAPPATALDPNAAFDWTPLEEAAVEATGSFPRALDVLCETDPENPTGQFHALRGEAGPVSGDLSCGERSLAIEVERLADLGEDTPSASELLRICLEDVRGAAWDLSVAPVLGTEGCLDADRWLVAMGLSANVSRSHRFSGERAEILHRMMQQWIGVYAFIAREAAQQARLRSIAPDSAEIPSDVLDVLAGGWDVFLFPRFATALSSMPEELLAEPDYRTGVLGDAPEFGAHREQAVGLPVAIAEALRAQLDLATRVVHETHLADEDPEPTLLRVAALMKRTQIMRATAAGLAERARSADAAWLDRYDAAALALGRSHQRLSAALGALLTGANPLGVDDTDLPLFVDGDLTGANARFSAVSATFLDGMQAWALDAVSEAQNRLESARAAWTRQQTRRIHDSDRLVAHQDRMTALKGDIGDQLFELCGKPDALSTDELLTDWPPEDARRVAPGEDATADLRPFSARTCFFRDGLSDALADACFSATPNPDPSEDFEPVQWFDGLSTEAVEYQLCVVGWLPTSGGEQPFSEGVIRPAIPLGFGNTTPALGVWFDAYEGERNGYHALVDCAVRGELLRNDQCAQGFCFSCADDDTDDGRGEAIPIDVDFFDIHSDFELDEARAACRRVTGYREDTLPTLETLLESAFQTNIGRSRAANQRGEVPDYRLRPSLSSCVRGEIGDRVIEIEALALAVEAARERQAQTKVSYDIAIQSCLIAEEGSQQVITASTQHLETMQTLRIVKTAADSAAAAAGAVKDCAASASPNPVQTGVTCGAAGVEAAANIVSSAIGAEMERAEEQHGLLVQTIEAETERRICYNDAEQFLVTTRELSIEVNRAMVELSGAVVRYNNAIQRAQALYDEGRADLAALESRQIPTMAHDYWLDEDADRYVRAMDTARRLTSLAVRAVEYERQAILGDLRLAVLSAQLPADLEEVVQSLQPLVRSPGINGRDPQDLPLVLSLRHEILQLADQQADPPGNLALTEAERFRLYIQAPRFAVFDEDGEWLGQRVPFSLAPLAALGLRDAGGVPIFAEEDCAERLWSVNASIQGGDALFRGDRTSSCSENRCRITLEKSNTFYSQTCDGGAFQVASVRPSRNLLSDGSGAVSGEEERFSRARIGTALNVPADAFEAGDYDDGASSELAGRGLYGEYALVIPASSISVLEDDGSYTDGLVLDAVDDIILRIDYTSVAR